MSKVVIMTDSTCDLPKSVIEEKGIVVVPLTVNFAGKAYQDYYKVNAKGLLDAYSRQGGDKPTCSPISQSEFSKYFEENLKDDSEIVYIGVSSAISGCIANSNMAMGMLMSDKISIIDSKAISSGVGLIVLKACMLKEYGATAKAIASSLPDCIKNVHTFIGVDEIDTISSTGKCTIKKGLFGPKKAVLSIRNGKMEFTEGLKGKGFDMLDSLVDTAKKEIKDLDDKVYITSVVANESSKYVRTKLEGLGYSDIVEVPASASLATQLGEGAVLISYINKIAL